MWVGWKYIRIKLLMDQCVYCVWVVSKHITYQFQQLTYDMECRSSSEAPWISTSLILSSDEGMDTLTGDSLESDLVVSRFSWALFNSLWRGFKIGRVLFCWCIIIKKTISEIAVYLSLIISDCVSRGSDSSRRVDMWPLWSIIFGAEVS